MVEVRYDREADALYLTMLPGEAVARTEHVDDATLVDETADGQAVGIEVLRPSRAWPLDVVLERYHIGEDDAMTLRRLFGPPTVA